MKGKRVGIVLAVLLLLGSVVSLSFMSNIPREKPDKEEINDRTIDQQSDEAPSALLKITQTLEPVLLGKTGQAAGEVAYSFSVKPLTSGIKHISFLSGNPDVKFVEYVLLPEDDSDNVEEGFAENRVLRQSTSQQLSPDGTIPCNATKWLESETVAGRRRPAGRVKCMGNGRLFPLCVADGRAGATGVAGDSF